MLTVTKRAEVPGNEPTHPVLEPCSSHPQQIFGLEAMIGENQQLITNEPIEFEK